MLSLTYTCHPFRPAILSLIIFLFLLNQSSRGYSQTGAYSPRVDSLHTEFKSWRKDSLGTSGKRAKLAWNIVVDKRFTGLNRNEVLYILGSPNQNKEKNKFSYWTKCRGKCRSYKTSATLGKAQDAFLISSLEISFSGDIISQVGTDGE